MDVALKKKADPVRLINQNKRLLQVLVVAVGVLFLAASLYSVYTRANVLAASSRGLKHLFGAVAKPAELGIFPVVALYAVRLSLKAKHDFKDLARWVFRLLQVVHIPLASIVVAAAAVHGVLYTVYLWQNNLRYWSGIAALGAMLVVSLLGLGAIKGRKYRSVHLVTGLVAFGLTLLHIMVA